MGLNAVVARPIDNSDLFSTRARLQFFPSFLVPRPALSCFRYRNKSFTRASIIEHVPRRKQHHSPPLATKPERRGRELNSSFLARTADISRRNPVIRSRSFYGQTRLEMRFARNRGVAHSISYDDASPPPHPPVLRSINSTPSFSEISRFGPLRGRILFEAKWKIVVDVEDCLSDFRFADCNDNVPVLRETCLLKGRVCAEVKCARFRYNGGVALTVLSISKITFSSYRIRTRAATDDRTSSKCRDL